MSINAELGSILFENMRLNSKSSTDEIRDCVSSKISWMESSSDPSIAISSNSALSLIAPSTDKKILRNFSSSVFSLFKDWESSKSDQVDSSDNFKLISCNELSFWATSKIPPEITHAISETRKI